MICGVGGVCALWVVCSMCSKLVVYDVYGVVCVLRVVYIMSVICVVVYVVCMHVYVLCLLLCARCALYMCVTSCLPYVHELYL